MFQFVGSIEVFLADVQTVASSEISARQLTAMVEEELRDRQEINHMDKKANRSPRKCASKGKNVPIFYTVLKGAIFVVLLALLGFILFPSTTMSTVSWISSALPPKTKLRYSLRDTDWYFFSLQYFRIATTNLKLEKLFPASDVRIGACMMNNPLYAEDEVDCSLCKNVETFTSISNDDGKAPLLIENQNIRFSLGRLQQILTKDSLMLNQHTMSVTSNRGYIKSLEDLRNDKVLEMLQQDKDAHVFGTAQSYMASHILRNEFPRPKDFVNRVMLTYMSNVYIDGERSPTFNLRTTSSDSNLMYIQCLGSRRLVFSPKDQCFDSCQTFSRIMKKGDIVIYSNLWSVESEPYGNSMSIVFLDNFDIEQSTNTSTESSPSNKE